MAAAAAGWAVADTMSFPDHHPYSLRDFRRFVQRARAVGARRIVTTEKDIVRLLRFRPFPMPIVTIPLRLEPQPIEEFREWLSSAIRAARDLHD